MMSRSPLTRWLIFAGCFALAYALFTFYRVRRWEETAAEELAARQAQEQAAELAASVTVNPSQAPLDFTLTDQSGQPFHSASLQGQVWVGSFFFTNCPAVCWRLNQLLAGVQAVNADSRVRFVSISCDPENDTPDALARYAERFHADPRRWTFLTGDMATIARLGKDRFKVSVEKGVHSDRAFVVDQDGKVRGRFRVTEPDQFEKLKKLLATLEGIEPTAASAEVPAASGAAVAPADGAPAESAPVDGAAAAKAATPAEGSSP